MDIINRDSLGKFIYTTGEGRYERKELCGKNHQKQRLVWFENFGTIPPKWIVHHINGNKYDNRIENLACMDITMHNKIHSHEAWNKGKKAPAISKAKMGHPVSKEQIKKQKETWKRKMLDSMIMINTFAKNYILFTGRAERLVRVGMVLAKVPFIRLVNNV
jgi:hypothetical protein